MRSTFGELRKFIFPFNNSAKMINIIMVDTSELWCFGRRLQQQECTDIFEGTLNIRMRYTCDLGY